MAPLSTASKTGGLDSYDLHLPLDNSSDNLQQEVRKVSVSRSNDEHTELEHEIKKDDDDEYKKQRQLILEQASNRLPHIVRVMSRASRRLSKREGIEMKEMRSHWRIRQLTEHNE